MVFIKEKMAIYASVADMASYMGLSTDSVRRIVEELKEYKGRYPYAVGKSGNILRVNILAFVDYFVHRDEFKRDEPVPPFDAKAVRDSLGMQTQMGRIEL